MILSGMELLAILVSIINLAVLAKLKNKDSVITAIIISNLLIILGYCLIIKDQKILREVVLANIIYSIIIMILVFSSNYEIKLSTVNNSKILKDQIPKVVITFVFLSSICLIVGCFYVAKNIAQLSNFISNKQQEKQIETEEKLQLATNPNVYLAKNVNKIEKPENLYSKNDKKKLKNNILFNRSTEAIMIIAGIMTALLFNYRYQNN